MFRKILKLPIGLIAGFVICAARELWGLRVAVYSIADIRKLHIRCAEMKVCILPGNAKESYLNIKMQFYQLQS